MSQLTARLQEFVEDFGFCQGQEKLEYLLQLAQELQPLPSWLREQPDKMIQIRECMTPVFVFLENRHGRLTYHFDVPDESPTVRGYATILQQGLAGASPAQVQNIPVELYSLMGLDDVLSQQRLNGIRALMIQLKVWSHQA
jgi:cysteine desulfuration protein SufE